MRRHDLYLPFGWVQITQILLRAFLRLFLDVVEAICFCPYLEKTTYLLRLCDALPVCVVCVFSNKDEEAIASNHV